MTSNKRKLRSTEWFGSADKNGFMYRSWMKNQGIPDYEFNNKGEKVSLANQPTSAFLTPAQIAEAKIEMEQIRKLGAGSTFVARRAVEFATKSPADSRLPESLQLAVRGTRYGCQDCETGKYSKAAHDILKSRFARTESAKKTPYWFKDASCEAPK